MTGSSDVKPTEPRPHVLWAQVKHAITGAAGSFQVAFTHSAEEGVAKAVIEDLEVAVKAVLLRHGFEL
jgi:hypothetical protein